MATVVSLGIHIADVLGRPVTQIPPGQNLALLDEIRLTVAGTAAGTSVDLAKLGADVYAIGAIGRDELGNFIERPALHVIGASGELTFEDVDFDIISRSQFLHIGGTPLLKKLDGDPLRRVF